MEDKKEAKYQRPLPANLYEATRNILSYFTSNSDKYLTVPFKPEDLEIEVDVTNTGIKGINLLNIGEISFYKENNDESLKELISEFLKNKELIESSKIKTISPNNFKLIPKGKSGVFYTLEPDFKTKEYDIKNDKDLCLMFSTYLTKIPQKTLNNLKEIDFTKLKKFTKIAFLFNVPSKLEKDLKSVKEKVDKILELLPNFTGLKENLLILYWFYKDSKEKYNTEDEIRKVKGSFTKYIILDKTKQVDHTSDIDNEVKERLLTEEEQSQKLEKKDNTNINILKFFKFIKKLENSEYHFEMKYSFKIKLKWSLKIQDELEQVTMKEFKLKGRVRSIEYNYFFKEVVKDEECDESVDLKEQKTFDIEVPDEIACDACKEKIPNENGVYYCYWCKIFFCEKCVENKIFNSTSNKERYLHKQHNLVYFKTRDKNHLSNLELCRLGKNVYLDKPAGDFKFNHSAICNGCRGHFDNSPRFLCVSCFPGKDTGRGGYCDFCFKCFDNLRKDNEECVRLEGIAQDDENEINDLGLRSRVNPYHLRTHVYLVLICSCRNYDYYEF